MSTSIHSIDSSSTSDPAELARAALRGVQTHGVVCIRGVRTIDAAQQLAAGIPVKGILHSGTKLGLRQGHPDKPDFTSVDSSNNRLFWHRERSYLPCPPDLLFFWCEKAPAEGGGTLLCDGREVARRLPDALAQTLRETLVLWRVRLPYEFLEQVIPVNSAVSTAVLDRHLQELRSTLPDYEQLDWRHPEPGEQYAVELRFQTPILAPRSLWGAEPVLCNFVINGTRLPLERRSKIVPPGFTRERQDRPWTPQGEPLPLAIVDAVEARCDAVGVEHRWQDHDLVVIDNSRVMHARRSFSEKQTRVIWLLMGRIQLREGSEKGEQ